MNSQHHGLWLLTLLMVACTREPAEQPVYSDASGLLPAPESFRYPPEYGPFWVDLNDDGWPDLVYMNHGAAPSVYVNNEGKGFTDRGNDTGIRTSNWQFPQQLDRHGGSCGDMDNDGDADLFIGHGAKRGETLGTKFDELLKNDGGLRFRDVTKKAGTLNEYGRSRVGSWMDYNNDGWLDLYVNNFASANVLYENNGDGTFSDVTKETGLGVPGPRAGWADYDLDGHVDVLVAWPLALFRNRGDGTFTNVSRPTGFEPSPVKGPYSLAWGDFDNDGDPDVFVNSFKSSAKLLVNNGGRFEPYGSEHDWGLSQGTTANGATWGDADNDGDLDLFVSRSDRVLLFENLGENGFQQRVFELPDSTRVARGGDLALGDYDGDGYLDLALDTKNRHLLLHNDASGQSWLMIRFEGRRSNRMGFGTKVWASGVQEDGADLQIYREYTGDSGVYRSIGCGPLHLGLGTAEHVDIRIRWLSGVEHTIEHVEVNQVVTVREPE